jgi:hypothetical protein
MTFQFPTDRIEPGTVEAAKKAAYNPASIERYWV